MKSSPITVSKDKYLHYVNQTRNIAKGEVVEGMCLYELARKVNNNKNINKILQFINNDDDKKVTNEVECIILQNLINGHDRIKMPEKSDYKFVTDEFCFTEKGQAKIFGIQQKNNNFDKLVDEDGDGYADYRITADFKKIDLKGVYKVDTNLDGKFDEQY